MFIRLRRLAPLLLALLPFAVSAPAQTPTQAPVQQPDPPPAQSGSQPSQEPAASAAQVQAAPSTPTPAPASPSSAAGSSSQSREITEDELKSQLVGKPLFLRGGYLGDNLTFNEHGLPVGHPAVGSYTLSGVQIDKVHLTRHKLELEGSRYALHFLGALPYEDPDKAVDRVKITPRKKVLRITIDREQVIKPKKEREEKNPKEAAKDKNRKSGKLAPAAAPATTASAQPAPEEQEEKEDKTDLPADKASVTTTISAAHATGVLHEALNKIFAPGLDEQAKAHMPQFWQLYYQAQAAGVDYRPADLNVLRSSAVDQQAKVLTSIAPDSNEFAQANGIAGRALYRVVIGSDGKPGEIAVVRPIGFGLDENAVAAIDKATFQPAVKGGQPVAETLDLAVLFRIYSKRTSVAAPVDKAADEPVKPGPYTIRAQGEKPQ